MKKLAILGVFVLVAVLALGAAGLAYAQRSTPPAQTPGNSQGVTPGTGQGYGPGRGFGAGMMGGRGGGYGPGMMGGYGRGTAAQTGSAWTNGYGPIHTYMVNALASQLGLTPEELQTRITNGETPYQVAVSLGFTSDQIQTMIQQAHDDALQQAVADGAITQAQADWMDQHMEQMWANGFGPGSRGGFGPGAGGCPMWNNTNTSNTTGG